MAAREQAPGCAEARRSPVGEGATGTARPRPAQRLGTAVAQGARTSLHRGMS